MEKTSALHIYWVVENVSAGARAIFHLSAVFHVSGREEESRGVTQWFSMSASRVPKCVPSATLKQQAGT